MADASDAKNEPHRRGLAGDKTIPYTEKKEANIIF